MVFVLCFIFLFRWFFGLIRPGFCYVTFLKIPLLIEEISCILWFFWESFYRKDPTNGFLMERSIFIFVSFSNFGQLVVFSFLQIFFKLAFSPFDRLRTFVEVSIYSVSFFVFLFLFKSKNCFLFQWLVFQASFGFKLHWLSFCFF